jgi:hypothetical protein
VPLSAGGGYCYYYIEIPKLTRPKYEVTTVSATNSPCAGAACCQLLVAEARTCMMCAWYHRQTGVPARMSRGFAVHKECAIPTRPGSCQLQMLPLSAVMTPYCQ